MIFDPRSIAKVSERIGVELFSIVRDEDLRDPKSADDALLNEASDILLCDGCQWLYFYPFGEAVDPHN